MCISLTGENLRACRCKSVWAFLKRPQDFELTRYIPYLTLNRWAIWYVVWVFQRIICKSFQEYWLCYISRISIVMMWKRFIQQVEGTYILKLSHIYILHGLCYLIIHKEIICIYMYHWFMLLLIQQHSFIANTKMSLWIKVNRFWESVFICFRPSK